MTKEKCLKEYRVTAKMTRYYEANVLAYNKKDAWREATIEKPHLFEECITHGDWKKVRLEMIGIR